MLCVGFHIERLFLFSFKVLDARFFGSGPSLPLAFGDLDIEALSELNGVSARLMLYWPPPTLGRRYISPDNWLSSSAQLHPELTMPMFSGIFA